MKLKTLQHSITSISHVNSSNKMFCSIHDFTFLMIDKKIKGQVSFESSEKKETFACANFSKICYIACPINRTGKLICLRASLHECDCTGLIDKPKEGGRCKRAKNSLKWQKFCLLHFIYVLQVISSCFWKFQFSGSIGG